MKVIGVVGSPRKNGNTAYLLEEVMKILREKCETEIIFLKDYDIKPCEGCRCCEENEGCIIENVCKSCIPNLRKLMSSSCLALHIWGA